MAPLRRARRCPRFLAQPCDLSWNGAAPESNRPSVGLPRLTDFEDRLGHRARAAPRARNLAAAATQDTHVAAAEREAVGVVSLEQELRRPPADAERVPERRERDRLERRERLAAALVELERDGIA